MVAALYRPESIDEAVDRIVGGGRVLAGGQSLMPLVRRGAVQVRSLVDINPLRELDHVELLGDRVQIGALARLEPLRRHPLIRRRLPLLRAALDWVGNHGVRMRGTLVGNLVQNGPGAEAAAAAALCDVELEGRGARGAGVWSPELLPPDVLVVAARLKVQPAGARAGFWEAQKRFGHLCSVGCGVVVLPGGAMSAVFAGLTAAALPAPNLAAALAAGCRDDARLAAAVRDDLAGQAPRTDIHADGAYRLAVAPVAARRALDRALRGEGEAP